MVLDEKLKKKAFDWCSKFLAGAWANIDIQYFKIKDLPGGLTNYIFICELDDSIKIQQHEHRKVLLRIYGEISGPHEKFFELLIFNLLSERKSAPRLLGAFKSGRLEEYIQSVNLTVHQLRSCEFLPQIAKLMAKYHLMEVPFSKKPSFIARYTKRFIGYLNKAILEKDSFNEHYKKIIEECVEHNLLQECQNLLNDVKSVCSPVVFCHNDVQEGNLLLHCDAKGNVVPNSPVTLIDYEYSYYGYRGYDIGNHFCEWVFQNDAKTPLGFDFDLEKYPNESQQMVFAKEYLKIVDEELKDAPESIRKYHLCTPEQLLYEANSYSLVSHLFWCLWGFAQYYLSHIEFSFLDYSIVRFRSYRYFKEKYYPKTS